MKKSILFTLCLIGSLFSAYAAAENKHGVKVGDVFGGMDVGVSTIGAPANSYSISSGQAVTARVGIVSDAQFDDEYSGFELSYTRVTGGKTSVGNLEVGNTSWALQHFTRFQKEDSKLTLTGRAGLANVATTISGSSTNSVFLAAGADIGYEVMPKLNLVGKVDMRQAKLSSSSDSSWNFLFTAGAEYHF